MLVTYNASIKLAALWAIGAIAALPTVDLGYAVQQATIFDTTGGNYEFNNIRFAKPPVGNLRFRAPQPPDVNRTEIQNGSVSRTCPSVVPSWLGTAYAWIPQYYAGKTNFTLPSKKRQAASSDTSTEVSEDCLFLDVVVPKDIFEQAGKGYGAPVLVWIYGGGYTLGNKNQYGSPLGLIKQSQNNNGRGVVYVAMNYRLGAFGWLSGPTFQESGGLANAGLYDQKLALEWIQTNIAKFGGDPNKVTIFGESAGGGSIMHQITAFGGAGGPPPFQQAILQSPGWLPLVSSWQQETFFNRFLELANVTTLDEARNISTETLQMANSMQITASSYGSFTYGPAVDGVFAPQLPGQLLARGQFHKDLRVILGHNANEGILFTPPIYEKSDTVFAEVVKQLAPSTAAWPAVVQYIVETLYPSQNYSNEIERTSTFIAEAIFNCNTFYLDKAFENQTHSYLFAIPPAEHGNDIGYTFYNNGTSNNRTIALALQDYITQFAMTGYPSEEGVPYFPMYGNNATMQVLNNTGIRQTMDPAANERCNWLQKALYY